MPIEFTCPHCQSLLRVDDENAGKRARCPQCNVINRIPGDPVQPEPAPTVSQQFFMDSVSGQTYGPVTQSELDKWVQEGRVSASCMIRPTGQATAYPATVYYPSLGTSTSQPGKPPTTSPENNLFGNQSAPISSAFDETSPYVASAKVDPSRNQDNSGEIRPVEADIGQIFSRSFKIFQQEMGLLVGAAVPCCILSFVSEGISQSIEEMHNDRLILLALIAVIVLNLIQTFLVIGQTRIAPKLVRGQPASFDDLFSGGDKFLPVVGFYLLIIIPLCLGFILLIIPGILLVLYYWPALTLIIDRKSGVFESFGIAGEIGGQNLLNGFLMVLASIGIAIAGVLFCCVGLFFSAAYLSVLWAMAYLIMSGQIR